MGVIQRQSIKQSLVTYIGVLIGAVNILFIYPKMLSEAQYGLIQYILRTTAMVLPLVLLGISHVALRFFPDFRDKANQHNGFLFFLLLVVSIGLAIFFFVSFIFQTPILESLNNKENAELYQHYIPYILPLISLMAFSIIFSRYISNFNRIVVPQIFNNLFLKIGMMFLCILYFFEYIPFNQLMQGLIIVYGVILFSLVMYLGRLGHLFLKPQLNFINPSLKKKIADYAGFSLLASAGMLAFQIDFFMLGTLQELPDVAIYSIAFFIADSIDIPRKAVESISAPIVSNAWKKGDLAHIEELYKKSSLNLLIVGMFFLVGIWSCIDHLYELIPNNERYATGKYVVLILGFARLIDMITGINSQILTFSKYYRISFYSVFVLAGINIVANLILIPEYKVYGAAFATMGALIIYNIFKLTIIYIKLKMQPLSWKTLLIFGIGAGVYAITLLLPSVGHPLLNIAIKATFITVLYGSIIIYFNISQDITNLVQGGLKKIF